MTVCDWGGGVRKGAAKAAKGYACSVRCELSSLMLYERDPDRRRRGLRRVRREWETVWRADVGERINEWGVERQTRSYRT